MSLQLRDVYVYMEMDLYLSVDIYNPELRVMGVSGSLSQLSWDK